MRTQCQCVHCNRVKSGTYWSDKLAREKGKAIVINVVCPRCMKYLKKSLGKEA